MFGCRLLQYQPYLKHSEAALEFNVLACSYNGMDAHRLNSELRKIVIMFLLVNIRS